MHLDMHQFKLSYHKFYKIQQNLLIKTFITSWEILWKIYFKFAKINRTNLDIHRYYVMNASARDIIGNFVDFVAYNDGLINKKVNT